MTDTTENWDGNSDRRTQPAQPVYQIGLKLDVLHRDVVDMKSVLKDLTSAIGKLAIVEERQAQTSQALERAFAAISKIEERTSNLESDVPDTRRNAVWMDRAVWAGMTAIAAFVAKKVGLI